MSLLNAHISVLCALLALVATLSYTRTRRRELPLPPGPRKLPLVGNSFDLPVTSPWEAYTRWSKQYRTSVIILSSVEATDALLERRSLYDRYRGSFPMVVDLMGWDFNIALMKYGRLTYPSNHDPISRLYTLPTLTFSSTKRRRTNRRLFNHAFNVTASQQYRPQVQKAARLLLERLLDSPDDFLSHFRQLSGQVIMAVTYGINVLPKDDPYIMAAEKAMHSLAVANT
ncbi:cytochrome P450 [Mycena polygramma]|nr:cytochrome P450 [Mycena polygramma]